MKKSCKYCGGIHEKGYVCPKKPVHEKRYNDTNRFRNTSLWQRTRDYIKQRDKYLCQACLHNLTKTVDQYTTDDLEVHHIVPLHVDYELRAEHTNLITLCQIHHKMADRGLIHNYGLAKISERNESSYLI